MRILFLSRWFPYPPDNGSKIRIYNLIKQLACHHEVDLISFATSEIQAGQIEAMGQLCAEVRVIEYRPFQPNRGQALMGFFSRRPRSVIDTFNQPLQTAVDKALQMRPYDLIIVSQIDMAIYVLHKTDVPAVFEELEVTTIYERYAQTNEFLPKLRRGLTWWKLSGYVRELLRFYEGCTVVSAKESELLKRIMPGYQSIQVIPNGVDMARHGGDYGPAEPDTLIYSGALTYGANFDAMAYFIGQIFPLILQQRPLTQLYITGSLKGVVVEQLPQNENVHFTGYLDDIRPKIAQSWLSVVPLRIGGGTRLKVLESMALGTPVVSTSKGAEGLDLQPERDLLVADEPETFAAAVLKVLNSPDLRDTLSYNGCQAVTKYDWQHIGAKFIQFAERVAERC